MIWDAARLDAIAGSIEPGLTFNQLTSFDPRVPNGAPGQPATLTYQEHVANLKSAMIREAARNPYSGPVARVQNGLRALDIAFPDVAPNGAKTAYAGYMEPAHAVAVYGAAKPDPFESPTAEAGESGSVAGILKTHPVASSAAGLALVAVAAVAVVLVLRGRRS